MGANLKRYLPLLGTLVLAAAVVLRLLGQAELAQSIESIGGAVGVTSASPVGAAELTAAAAALTGVFLKVRSEIKKARA